MAHIILATFITTVNKIIQCIYLITIIINSYFRPLLVFKCVLFLS